MANFFSLVGLGFRFRSYHLEVKVDDQEENRQTTDVAYISNMYITIFTEFLNLGREKTSDRCGWGN